MGTNIVDPTSIIEQIKRARLYNPNFGAVPVGKPDTNITGGIGAPQSGIGVPQSQQAQSPQSPQSQESFQPQQSQPQSPQPQVQAPVSPRDQALADYRQTLQQMPSQANYHPTVLRRIAGALLGGIAGAHDPRTGYEVGHGIAYGPYEKNLSEYQKKLAQKKEAYETELGAEKESSLEQEQEERTKAETARALTEQGKLRSLQPGTPEYKGELEKLKIQHPNIPKLPVPYEITLKKDNEKIVGYEGQDGQFKDAEGNIYGTDAIKEARKVGTNEPRTSESKPPREGEAGAIDQWSQEHGRAPNYSERLAIHKDYETKPPANNDTQGFRREIQMQGARESAQRPHQRNLDLATQQLDRINRSISMIDTSKPEDIALAIPEILTALISGQSSGVRITTPEMNNLIHARGWGDSVEALTNKIRGLGSLSNKQKSDLKGLLTDVQAKVGDRQKDISDLMDKIDSAEKPEDIGKAQIEYRKKLTGKGTENKGELPGGITLDDINKEIDRRKKVQQ